MLHTADLRKIIFKSILLGLFLIFLSLHFADPIRLISADLGRHLKNGELILHGESKVLTSNFYSYTAQDFPFINHHWASGVLFYWIYKTGGFVGLSYFYIGILLCGFLIYFELARRYSSFSYALFFSVLALPLFTDRLEIRPEGISTLLTGLYLYFLFLSRDGKISLTRLWWVLPILQIIWVNTHILFFIGGFLVFVFLVDAWLAKRGDQAVKHLGILMGLVAAVCVINPNGLQGALVPLTIFKVYGYQLAENQNVFFMQKRFGHDPKYLYFECLSILAVVGLILAVLKQRLRAYTAEILILLFFCILGFKTVRSMASFAFVFIPLMAMCVYAFVSRIHKRWTVYLGRGFLAVAIGLVSYGVLTPQSVFSPLEHLAPFVLMNGGKPQDVNIGYLLHQPQIMTGLVPGINQSAEFFNQHQIQGPIFNNYDIGGYLIFYLYPRVKVFVDNRPEVYSVSFFKNMYVPMQENDALWKQMDEKYQFNSIFFYRHDLTPWGQNLMINRINDPQWAPIYVDLFAIIFVKRNEANRQLIEKYELPRQMFSVSR